MPLTQVPSYHTDNRWVMASDTQAGPTEVKHVNTPSGGKRSEKPSGVQHMNTPLDGTGYACLAAHADID